MGNTITPNAESAEPAEWLSMSNGLTAVFFDVLALSASALAANNREKELTIWFAENDQSTRGRGTVGFALSEIPWSMSGFQAEKQFLLRAVEGAENGSGWSKLNYAPNKETVTQALAKFHTMLEGFTVEQVSPLKYQEWLDTAENGGPADFPACPKHGVLLYWNGCVVCNNEVK